MSKNKLSDSLKALINASYARPDTVRAPSNIRSIYQKIAEEANSKSVGWPAWVTISTAATMTMNSPASLLELFNLSSSLSSQSSKPSTPAKAAELIREVGLKCISFNGIPRTINCLGAFRDGLPSDVGASLSTAPTRNLRQDNANEIVHRGRSLWNSIYVPFEDKLVDKLGKSHPDLPVHILSAHYGTLLSDPSDPKKPVQIGRVLTSLVAISCLRAQTGVGPQVISHIFGLRKAFDDGGKADEDVEGGQWLASDEGNTWILNSVDSIVKGIGAEDGGKSSYAPGMKAKL